MDTTKITDYLYELSNPSLKFSPNERLVNPWVIEQYLNGIESMRASFVAEVFTSENAELKSMYIDELKDAISKIEQRGYCNLKDENITQAIVAGIKEMELVNQVVIIDRGLLASAQKALKALSPKHEETPSAARNSEPIIPQETETIISGIRELAKALGVGINKAQAIVNSKILEKDGIQWNAGTWKFNKQKLLKFIEENPTAFSKIGLIGVSVGKSRVSR